MRSFLFKAVLLQLLAFKKILPDFTNQNRQLNKHQRQPAADHPVVTKRLKIAS